MFVSSMEHPARGTARRITALTESRPKRPGKAGTDAGPARVRPVPGPRSSCRRASVDRIRPAAGGDAACPRLFRPGALARNGQGCP
jgi:hypothetical protein